MTKKKHPLFRAAALLLGVLMLLLTACTNGSEPADTTGTQPPPAPVGSVRDLVKDYTIVYPTRATDGETAAAMQLAKLFGNSTRPKADYTADGSIPSGAQEILIGNTNRASSQAAIAALGRDRDYTVAIYEGEVVIAAKSDTAIAEAVTYFIETVLPASAAAFPVGTVYTYLHSYPLGSFFGLSVTGLTISCTDASLSATAKLLQSYINDATGAAAAITTDGSGNILLTVDSTMDPDSWAAEPGTGKVTLRAGSALSLNEAVKAITAGMLGGEAVRLAGSSTIPNTFVDLKTGKTLKLVWHDEFNGDSLDSSKWKLADRMWDKRVTTTTDRKNIHLENGEVVMNLYREDGKYYSHKTLTTMDRMSFQYGYLEIYAKVPFSQGSFPAFWLQSAKQHRTAGYMTEVDVFEVYRSGRVEGTLHKWELDANDSSTHHCWNNPIEYAFPKEEWDLLSDEYHLWGFGWNKDLIYLTVDGKIFATFDITDSGDFCEGKGHGTLTGMGGFQDPMYINFTNWVGTKFRDPNWAPNDSTEFPKTFSVAWIRLYQDETGTLYNDFR